MKNPSLLRVCLLLAGSFVLGMLAVVSLSRLRPPAEEATQPVLTQSAPQPTDVSDAGEN